MYREDSGLKTDIEILQRWISSNLVGSRTVYQDLIAVNGMDKIIAL